MSDSKAAPSGGKKKNQKKVTLSLQEFNKTIVPEHDPQSQWGDIAINEEEEFDSHNKEPTPSSDSFNRQNNRREPGGYSRDNQNRDNYRERDNYQRESRDRDNRQPRETRERKPQNEIPNQPPYVAYVGNLSYSVTKEDLLAFFSENCQVEDVRLIVDVNSPEKRSKGYGYITFKTREDLETALTANDYDLGGRPIRVDVSTPRESPQSSHQHRGGDRDRERSTFTKRENRYEPSRADNAETWERGKVVVAKPVENAPPRKEYTKNEGDQRRNNNRRENSRENSSERKEEARERQPLKLQPKSSQSPESDQNKESGKPKSNPFGEAKPRDEKLFEERRQKELAERAQQQPQEQTTDEKPSDKPSDEVKEKPLKTDDKKYRPPRGKSYNNRYNNSHNNNNNNRNQGKKKGGPRNEVQADSDGFVLTSKSAATPQSAQSSTPAPSSGPSIKNKYSALSNE